MIPILASAFLVFWLDSRASTADKVAIRAKWQTVFDDTNQIELTALPQWRVTATPTVKGWVLVVNEHEIRAHLTNCTLEKFNTWKSANLANPGYFQVRRGENITNVLYSAGLEPVPVPGGPTQ